MTPRDPHRRTADHASRYDDRYAGRYDESDARVRPSRRGSRPRSKDRPQHVDARSGLVVAVDRGRYTVEMNADPSYETVPSTRVIAVRARELGRRAVVVGDEVDLVGDLSGGPDTLARLVRVRPRRTVLRRTADDTDPAERIVVANADQLVVVTAVAEPQPRPRMVDRCLVAAYDGGLTPLLVMTKADLADPAAFLRDYAPLQLPTVVTRRRPDGTLDGLSEVLTALAGRRSVLVGHSGVGKSTLVNALVPDAERSTGAVNAVTGRGRHTSTSAVALRVTGSGAEQPTWVVDTPGVRSFGLAHVDPRHLLIAFPDLAAGAADCPRGCTHDEPDCALDRWVEDEGAGSAGPARLESLRRLMHSRGTDT
ncbi:MAG: ribosome small subunit-dependent GTPase A [Angustibacter sp.]